MADDRQSAGGGGPNGDLAVKIRESRDKLLRIFDGILDPIYIIDRSYALISVNTVQAKRYGATPREMVGKTCYRVLYGRSEPCLWCPIGATLSSGEPSLAETNLPGPDKSRRLFELHTYPITDDNGRVGQIILYLRDVTDRRRLERLASLGEAAAAIIHEIKAPLTVIQTASQILSGGEPDPQRKRLGETVLEETRRMNFIVQEILEFARGEGSYRLQLQPLLPVLEKVVDDLEPSFRGKGVSLGLEVADEPAARIDADRLHQVYLNLGMNALEVLPPGGRLGIRLSVRQDKACVEFEDDGPGIPKEILNSLFEPFVTGGKSQGTGLGLAIARRIVLGHGGQIVAANRPGGGASFSLSLPLPAA